MCVPYNFWYIKKSEEINNTYCFKTISPDYRQSPHQRKTSTVAQSFFVTIQNICIYDISYMSRTLKKSESMIILYNETWHKYLLPI